MKTVLVVDDDDDTRSLYRRVLTTRGYEVTEAVTVQDAIEKLGQCEPRAIVLDLELPDGNSTALLDVLARDKDAPPVVLCTSSEYGARVGTRYHITAIGKFSLTAIGDEVDRVIEQGRRPRVSRVSLRGDAESRPSMTT